VFGYPVFGGNHESIIFTVDSAVDGDCGFCVCAEFPKVPPDHWDYDSMASLADHGIIPALAKGTLTRYEFAEILAKSLPIQLAREWKYEAIDENHVKWSRLMEPENRSCSRKMSLLKKLVDEFKDELAALGVDVEGLRRKIAELNDKLPHFSNGGGGLRMVFGRHLNQEICFKNPIANFYRRV